MRPTARRVSPGKLPTWFRKIRDRDFGGRFNADWFDHPGRAGEALVVEPYGLSGDSLQDILAFADRYGLDVSVSATSEYDPTRTLSVSLTPRAGARAA